MGMAISAVTAAPTYVGAVSRMDVPLGMEPLRDPGPSTVDSVMSY